MQSIFHCDYFTFNHRYYDYIASPKSKNNFCNSTYEVGIYPAFLLQSTLYFCFALSILLSCYQNCNHACLALAFCSVVGPRYPSHDRVYTLISSFTLLLGTGSLAYSSSQPWLDYLQFVDYVLCN